MVATAELHAWNINPFLHLSSSSSSWWPQLSFTPRSPVHSYTYHHHHHGGHSRASRLDHQSIPTAIIIIIVVMVATAELHAWITNLFLHLSSSSSSSSWWPQPSFMPGSPIYSYTYHHHYHQHGGHSRASHLDHQCILTPIFIIIIIMMAIAKLHAWITSPFLHLSSSSSSSWWPQPSFTPGSAIYSYTYHHHRCHHGGHS